MTTERYQKYRELLAEFLSPDMNDAILAEKQANVIVDLGEALTKARAELEQTKADLQAQHDKRAAEAKDRKRAEAGVRAGLKAISCNEAFTVGKEVQAIARGEPVNVATPVLTPRRSSKHADRKSSKHTKKLYNNCFNENIIIEKNEKCF